MGGAQGLSAKARLLSMIESAIDAVDVSTRPGSSVGIKRSFLMGTRRMIRASNSGVSASRQIATTWSILVVFWERSRAILAKADALRSPARATRASDQDRAASWLITRLRLPS